MGRARNPPTKVIPMQRSFFHRTSLLATGLFLMQTVCGMTALADEWPQWRGADRDGVWTETGILDRFPSPEIEVKWRVPVSSGYSGPTVADGRVYVTDRIHEPEEQERVHCFDWETGETIWSFTYSAPYEGLRYPAGPRAAVTIHDGRAYALGAVGHLHCFDAADGTLLWNRDLREEYQIRMPNWGIAAAPLIEEDLVIVQIGGEGACLVAFDHKTGEEQWKALDDDASYSAPVMIEQADQRVLLCWTGDRIVGLNPRSGEEHWAFPFPWKHWPIGIATPVIHGELLLFSEAHKGTLLLKAPADRLSVEQVWHRLQEDDDDEPALHCLISTPIIRDGHVYAADNEGILRCLDLETGQQIWEDDSAVPQQRFATIHLIERGEADDRIWMFNERGELIISRLSPDGFEELSRAKLLDPTTEQLRRRDGVTWSHPAFAYRHVFARNDEELVCADLSAQPQASE